MTETGSKNGGKHVWRAPGGAGGAARGAARGAAGASWRAAPGGPPPEVTRACATAAARGGGGKGGRFAPFSLQLLPSGRRSHRFVLFPSAGPFLVFGEQPARSVSLRPLGFAFLTAINAMEQCKKAAASSSTSAWRSHNSSFRVIWTQKDMGCREPQIEDCKEV